MTQQAVGVLGGTFDPVHYGHLHVAAEAARVFSFPKVLLVPCATPPHKSPLEVTPAVHRVAMLRLAVAEREALEVDTLEVERGGTSYTIDTLRSLRRRGEGAPVFLIGMDALFELPTWHQHERLLVEFDLVAVDRPGGTLESARRSLGGDAADRIVAVPPAPRAEVQPSGGPPGRGGRIFHLPIPPLAVSSREIRGRVADSTPIDGLVPAPVARYIQEQGLYRREGSR